MILGILLCDDLSPAFVEEYGCYQDMFIKTFSAVDPSLEYRVFDVKEGDFPADIDQADAYLITGSRHGVYDGYPWIMQLEAFVRQLQQTQKKLIGICFGHQLIAQALGGVVRKSPKGWGIGLSQNQLFLHKRWMHQTPSQFNILVSHQDQVLALPPNTEVVAGSDFCPYYLLQIGQNILSIQGHPEYSKAFIKDLINSREDRLTLAEMEQGLASLSLVEDKGLIVQWLVNFLQA